MRRIRTYLLTLSICFGTIPLFCQKEHLLGEIKKLIRYEGIDLTSGSATVIGIIDGDSTYTYQLGTLATDNSNSVTDTTLFPVGGLSHGHLVLLAYHMEQLNLIRLNDTIGRFGLKEFDNTPIASLRISDLMAHRSGLPRILTQLTRLKRDADDDYRYYDQEKIDSALIDWVKANGLKKEIQPSHYNFYLLGRILWAVRDKRVHDNGRMVPEMEHTWFDSLSALTGQSVPDFYTAQGRKIGAPHFSGLTPAMGMISCMEDLLIVSKIFLRLSARDDFRKFCLSSELPGKRKDPVITNGGLHIIDAGKSGNLYFLTGVLKGSSAYLCFAPKTHTAVVVLHNSGKPVHHLGNYIMRMINYQFTRTY